MPSREKRIGTRAENYVVDRFNKAGIRATRTWGSNGESRGLSKEVDVVLEDELLYLQIKRRKTISKLLYRPSGTHAVILKQPHKEPLVVLRQEDFIRLLKGEPITIEK